MELKNEPKFSIIIPAFNAEKRLAETIASVTMQTFRDFEIIVVCDSCTDETDEVAAAYGAKMFYTDAGCDGAARNVGIENASGTWIMFLDDDDHWLHEFVLDQIARKINKDPTVDVICFSAIHKNSRYAPASINNIAVWNKVWKRSFIGDTRFPKVKSISDLYFHKAMLAKSPRYVEWDMPFYYYNYMRPGSQTWLEAQEKAERYVQR